MTCDLFLLKQDCTLLHNVFCSDLGGLPFDYFSSIGASGCWPSAVPGRRLQKKQKYGILSLAETLSIYTPGSPEFFSIEGQGLCLPCPCPFNAASHKNIRCKSRSNKKEGRRFFDIVDFVVYACTLFPAWGWVGMIFDTIGYVRWCLYLRNLLCFFVESIYRRFCYGMSKQKVGPAFKKL